MNKLKEMFKNKTKENINILIDNVDTNVKTIEILGNREKESFNKIIDIEKKINNLEDKKNCVNDILENHKEAIELSHKRIIYNKLFITIIIASIITIAYFSFVNEKNRFK